MATKKTTTTKKAEDKTTTPVKETAAKTASAKAEPIVEVKAAEVKAEKVKAPTKKAATKKSTTKKAAKAEITTSLFVQYNGKQAEDSAMVESVKAAWTEAGNKVEDIKTITLYVKPEDDAVYYVVNGTETGRIDF